MEPKTDVDPRSLLEHRDFVKGVVRGLLADEHAADDVVQETCLRAIERPPRHAALKEWLARVGRNLARTALRARRRRDHREREAARPERQPSAAEAASKLERHRLVVEAVLALDEPFRSAILLRFYEDLPPREIARQLGVPVDTVRSRLRRGIERMRAWFDARHRGDRAAWSLLLLPLLGAREAAAAAAVAATAAASATGGGTKVLALGGAAMAMKAKLVGAAIVLFAIAAGVVTWQATAAREQPAAARTEIRRVAPAEAEMPVERAEATATVENPGSLPDRGIGPSGHATTVYQGSATTGPITVATGSAGPKPYRLAEPCGEADRGALRVIVTDGAGNPLPGAKIFAGLFKNGRAKNTNAEADATGRLELRSLEPGNWSVSARALGRHRSAMVEVEAGRFTEIAFALAGEGATVEGVVRHVERGPLADVRISFSREDGGFADHFSATTDAQGQYGLEGVPPGSYPVRLEGSVIGHEPRPRAILAVPGPGTFTQDIVLGRITLGGTVRDADTGAPIAAARIQFQGPWYFETMTGSDGTYAVLDLVPGNYKVCITRDGWATEFSETGQILPDSTRTADFTLRRAAVLVLEVLDSAGQPIAGQIHLGVQPISVRHGEIEVSGNTGTVKGSISVSGTTLSTAVVAGSSGIARYPRIAPGSYRIAVDADGHLRGTRDVEIKPGENPVTFRLEREPEATASQQGRISLQGTVRDSATGRPVTGVRICVQEAGFREAFSDAQGVFRLREVPDGTWTVHVSRDGYGFRAFRDVEFADGTATRDFDLAPAATLHVHATDRAGRPVEGRLYLGVDGREDGLTDVGTSIDADGEGHGIWRQILPGRYELRIMKENVGEAKVVVEILPGENVVRVRLE